MEKDKEIDILKIGKMATLESVTQKTKAEARKLLAEIKKLKIEGETLALDAYTKTESAEMEALSKSRLNTVEVMYFLANIMATTIGNGESFTSPRLFSEDDLFEYKGKMLELLKTL